MSTPVKTLRNLPFYVHGFPLGTAANKFEIKIARERLPLDCFEEIGKLHKKGDYEVSVTASGYGVDAESKLIDRLGNDEEDDSSFLLLLEGDTRLSPHAAPGSPCLLLAGVRTFIVNLPAEKGKIKAFEAEFDNSTGDRPYFAQLVYTSRARVPAPLGGGDVITPSPITTGPLEAGTMGIFVVHVSKITGTGNVTLLCELLSDTSGFASPTTRHTFPLVVNDPTPGVGEVYGTPTLSMTFLLDGDAAAIPLEDRWTIRFTVTDSDTDGQVEVTAAGGIFPK